MTTLMIGTLLVGNPTILALWLIMVGDLNSALNGL